MKCVLILLLSFQGLLSECHQFLADSVLTDFLISFRNEYDIPPTDLVVMDFWEDEDHVYYGGEFIDGNNVIKFDDSQSSFLICFHRDGTVCNILSYENDYMNGIPVLLEIEQKYHLKTAGDDPDVKEKYPFIVDNPVRYAGDLGKLIEDISVTLSKRGIFSSSSRRIFIVLNVDKYGTASFFSIRGTTGNLDFDKAIAEYIESIVECLAFVPGSHRGYTVSSSYAIPVLIETFE